MSTIHRHALANLTVMAKDRYDAIHHPQRNYRELEAANRAGRNRSFCLHPEAFQASHVWGLEGKCLRCGASERIPVTQSAIDRELEYMEENED